MSPTKGILMTPGTAAARRKTVTFGEHVVDNEDKRPMKSGLPDDCPGKFPSPWAKPGADDGADVKPATAKGAGRSKLTEKLEQARDESAKRKQPERREPERDVGNGRDTPEPEDECCRYLKAQYDSYRENSQRDIKKLIAKQKAAKSFAKDKDFQCNDLADQLRQEKKKVNRLQKRTAELEAQLKEMQDRFKADLHIQALPKVQAAQRDMPTTNARSERPAKIELPVGPAKDGPSGLKTQTEATTANPTATTADMYRTRDAVPVRKGESAPKADTVSNNREPLKLRVKQRPETIRTKTQDDIWNQSFSSSNVVQIKANPTQANGGASSPKSRAVTSGTDLTPLKSLSINTLPTEKLTRRDSAQPSPPNERFVNEPLVRQEIIRSPKPDDQRTSSPARVQGANSATANRAERPEAPKSPTPRVGAPATTEKGISVPVPPSSPFVDSPVLSPPNAAKESYFERKREPQGKDANSPPSKENLSPTTAMPGSPSDKVKPTAAWNAINAPNTGKRVVSLKGKDITVDRLEAARARMAARGRVVS
jgi:hypothetical protein